MKKEKCNGCNRWFTLCGLSSHFQHQKDCKSLHFSIANSNNDIAIPKDAFQNEEASKSSPTRSLEACPINNIRDEIHNIDNESQIIYNEDTGNDFELENNDKTTDELENENNLQEMNEHIQMDINNIDHSA